MEPSRQLGEEEKTGGASVVQHHPQGTFYSQLLHLGKPDFSLLPGVGCIYLDRFRRALLLHTTPSTRHLLEPASRADLWPHEQGVPY